MSGPTHKTPSICVMNSPPPLAPPFSQKVEQKAPKCIDHVANARCDLLQMQALNDFIDRKLQASPIKSLIVYPEGRQLLLALHCIHTLSTPKVDSCFLACIASTPCYCA